MNVMEQPPREEDEGHLAWSDVVDGRYEIERPLGHGGMGSVYLARDREFDRKIALKVLAITHMGKTAREQRFENEARYAGRLPIHANIATTLDTGRMANGRPYIVMEYVEGPAINVLSIFEDRPLELVRMLELMCGVAEALSVMHRAGVVHRDLTPANILVTEIEGRSVAKVIDFSHAAADVPRLRVGDPRRLTGAHETLGTAGYMPPEQVRSDSPAPRMDVFAFGVVLWELLSNKQAFRHLQRDEYIDLQTKNPTAPPPLAELRRDLPPSLYRLVEDCTHVHIAARPAASAVVLRLTEIIDELRSNAPRPRRAAMPSGGVTPLPAPTFRPLGVAGEGKPSPRIPVAVFERPALDERQPRPTRIAWWIVLAVVAFAAVLTAIFVTREDGEAEDAEQAAITSSNDTFPRSPEPRSSGPDPRLAPLDVASSTSATAVEPGDGLPESSGAPGPERSSTGTTAPVMKPKASDSREPAPQPEEREGREPVKSVAKGKPKPERSERCKVVRAETQQARDEFDWAAVLAKTDAEPACWSRQERKRLRVPALAELGRYAACVREGSGSTDPVIVRQVQKCEGVSP